LTHDTIVRQRGNAVFQWVIFPFSRSRNNILDLYFIQARLIY
ncbi:MAG: hypothetical protein ACI91R_001743, partial [Vicingaceae bacterium]